MHPILITALVEDRWRRCPCGAGAQRRYGLCRGGRVAAVWWPERARTRHRAVPSWICAMAARVRLFARVASGIRLSSRKAES